MLGTIATWEGTCSGHEPIWTIYVHTIKSNFSNIYLLAISFCALFDGLANALVKSVSRIIHQSFD